MESDLGILAVTAATIGFVHTITGPDHYLPFIVIGRARRWGLGRTLTTTALCGLGHVLSSVVLGAVGIGLGVAVGKLEIIEGTRGEIAAWLLMSFGLLYAVWGLRQARRGRVHTHRHAHGDGTVHRHDHDHHAAHAHVHEAPAGQTNLTPWALFIIFVLGPCEPLIPILMYPAAQASLGGLVAVTAIFGVVTIATMLGMVVLADRGVRLLPLGAAERYAHALAGGAILGSGMAIRFLGL
ncbi:sulfite exporter TauE/SafE family protein [bacterium]|nr:sulfite exporter TauE/SafE family protein [bacterium]